MPVIVSEPDQKDWELPEDGQYIGVIADVIDLGLVKTGFGEKRKVQIKWLLDAADGEGKQFQVSVFHNASLHKDANLRKCLKSILGADVSGEFDLEEILGINNQLVIEQNTKDDKTYANVIAILKVPKGSPRLEIPADFVRKSEKDGEKKQQAKQAKRPAPQLKQAAPSQVRRTTPPPAPVEEVYEESEQVEVEQEAEQEVSVQPVRQAAPAPANRAGTIRQARTVTPAPAVQSARQARTTAPAAPAQQPIDDSDIPF